MDITDYEDDTDNASEMQTVTWKCKTTRNLWAKLPINASLNTTQNPSSL